jgi:ribonuclease BN (tRNA processing enzyme)
MALDAGGLTSRLSFSAQMKLKAVLLTHYHYDHIRDIPTLAMNRYLHHAAIDVYSTAPVYEAVQKYLLDGVLYPAFLTRPEGMPILRYFILPVGQPREIADYEVQPVAMNHTVPTTGYQIKDKMGQTIFYSGDTGPGLDEAWAQIKPDIMFIEVTGDNGSEGRMTAAGHLTPHLLEGALIRFAARHKYLPRVVAVHIYPAAEDKIKAELTQVALALNIDISVGREGQVITL